MPSETYSFLDVAVLDEVRERFAAGDALAILSADLEQVIWANGPGALLFDYRDVEAIIGADARLGASARRQIMSARGFPAIGRDRPILVRMASGVSSRIEAFLASAVTLPDGEAAILLAVPAAATGAADATTTAARAISGFTEAGHFVAMVAADGTIAAASPGFAGLGLGTDMLAAMTERLAGGRSRVTKRMLPAGSGSLPAGMARLTDDPALHLLVVIDEGRTVDGSVAATQPEPTVAEAPLDEVVPDVAESIVPEPVPDVAASLPDVAEHDSWYFSAGGNTTESAALDATLDEETAASRRTRTDTEPLVVAAEQDDVAETTADIAASEPEAATAPEAQPGSTPESASARAPESGDQHPEAVIAADAGHVDDHAVPQQTAVPPEVAVPLIERAEPAERVTTAVRFVWRTDSDGRFSQMSPEFAGAVGEAAADVIGRRFEDVANTFGLDPAGEIAGLLARRDTWSGRSVLWPVAGTDRKIPVDLAALPVYNRLRVFEGFRGFGVARANDAVADPERLGLVLVPGPFTPPEQTEPPTAQSRDEPVEAPKAADPFHGEVPVLVVTPAPDRRSADKIIRLAEHRPSSPDKGGLSSVERLAFQQIGERLKKDSEARAGRPAPTVEPVGKVLELPERRTDAGPAEPASPAPAPAPEVASRDQVDITIIERQPLPGDGPGTRPSVGLLAEDIVAEPAVAETPATVIVIEEAPEPSTAVQEPVIGAAAAPPAPPAPELQPDEEGINSHALPAKAGEMPVAEKPAPNLTPAVGIEPSEPAVASSASATEQSVESAEPIAPQGETAPPVPLTPEPPTARKAPRPGMSLLDFAQWDEPDATAQPAVGGEWTAIEPAGPSDSDTLAAAQPANPDADESSAEIAIEPVEPEQADTAHSPASVESAVQEDSHATEPLDAGRDAPSTVVAMRPHRSPDIAADHEKPAGYGLTPPTDAGPTTHPEARRALPVEGERRKLTDTAILEKLPVPVLVHSGDVLHYANDEFFRLTGYASIDDLAQAGGIGVLFADSYDDDEHGGRRDRQLRVRARDGEEFPAEAFLQSVAWNGGKALLLVLSRAKEGEPTGKSPLVAELEALVAEMRTIIDTATDGVVLIARDGSIRSISRPAEALFGFDSDEVKGKPFASLFAMESQRAARDYLEGLSGSGVASVLNDGREVIGREAQGRFIPLFMTIGSLPGDSGFCAVVRDITQWKRAEEDLTQARAVAERASSHKTDFLARVSHEIRTPLNAIIGFSELMLDERFGPVANDRYRDYLRDINRSGNHVLDLVNDLLDISKIEAGQQEMASDAVSLNETLAETVAMMQPQANRERVIIRSSFASKLPDVVADLRSVRQIALNILSNAVRYTQAGGQVIVSTAYDTGGDIVMRVRDTGIGMTQAEIELALKPFKQINSPRRTRGDGTGLGLPLTKAMVEANRARFMITSTPGEGTLVEVVFPSTRVLAN